MCTTFFGKYEWRNNTAEPLNINGTILLLYKKYHLDGKMFVRLRCMKIAFLCLKKYILQLPSKLKCTQEENDNAISFYNS